MTGALENFTRPAPQREDVTRPPEVPGATAVAGQGTDGGRPILGRDARRRRHVVDSHREGRLVDIRVMWCHQGDLELVEPLTCHRGAENPGGVPDHEGDHLGCRVLRRDHEITLFSRSSSSVTTIIRPARNEASACSTSARHPG